MPYKAREPLQFVMSAQIGEVRFIAVQEARLEPLKR